MAWTAGRRLYAAHQSSGRRGRRTLVAVNAVDRGRGIVPRAEKRAVHPALVSSTGTARQSSRDGRVPQLRFVGHAETSAETPRRDHPAAVNQLSRQCTAILRHESFIAALQLAERRYCSANHGWSRDPSAPYY